MNTKTCTKITLADNYAADKRATVIAKTSFYGAPLYYITKNQLAAAERSAGMLGGSCMRIAPRADLDALRATLAALTPEELAQLLKPAK